MCGVWKDVVLCKLTIVLVLNRCPSGSSYQLCLVHLFASLPSAASAFHFALYFFSTQNCFIEHRLLMSSTDAFLPAALLLRILYTRLPPMCSAHLAVIPVPVGSLPLPHFIRPVYSFQMTPPFLCSSCCHLGPL